VGAGGGEFPSEDGEGGEHGDVHGDEEPKVARGGELEAAGFFGLEVGGAFGGVADIAVEVEAVDDGDGRDAEEGVAPAIGSAEGEGEGGETHGGGGGTEVSPSSVNAFGEADLFSGEPFTDEANADDEAGADEAHEEASEGEHFVAFCEGEEAAKEASGDEEEGVGDAWSEFVNEDADDDAGRDGEGDVEDEEGLPLGGGDVEGLGDGGLHGGVAEPQDEGHEEGKPGDVEGLHGGRFEIEDFEFADLRGVHGKVVLGQS